MREMISKFSQSAIDGSHTGFCSMDDGCINNIFDCLTIEDLCRIKVTCKRLYLLANEHFVKTYSQLFAGYNWNSNKDALENITSNKFHKSFDSIIQRVHILNDVRKISDFGLKINKNVKYIRFWSHILNIDSNNKNIKNQLINVQGIYTRVLCDNVLQFFPNLEYIAYHCDMRIRNLLGNYPTLKQFDCTRGMIRMDKSKMENFFKRHPNIKTFSSDQPFDITNWLLKSRIKFDDLVLLLIGKGRTYSANERVYFNQIIENLHLLHKNQQIKILHLKIDNEDFWLSPAFQTLKFVESIDINVVANSDKIINALISLPNLKLLVYHKRHSLYEHHFKILAEKLNELEEFHTDAFNNIDDLIPFVRYSKKIRCIYIQCYSNNCSIRSKFHATIQKLDKERRQLEGACKLTIYMDEEHYLHMKNNSSTSSYGRVEIKRTDSYPLSTHPLRLRYD